jgi:hypothetical protein
VYGAAIAYGPVMDPALRDPILRKALCGGAEAVRIEYRARSSAGRVISSVEVSCK